MKWQRAALQQFTNGPIYYKNKTAQIIMPLYKMLISLHLEYYIQFWSLHLKKDIVELEKVQKRVTKMIYLFIYLL